MVNDKISLDLEVESVVLNLRPHRAGEYTHLRVEHLKLWWKEAYPSDNSKTPTRMDQWLCLVYIVQHMWCMGDIPQELEWTVLVLTPKGTTDTWVIGLIETPWKVVEVLIDTRLCARRQLHDVLHGFRDVRGRGTAIMELKLAQELVPSHQQLIDLKDQQKLQYISNKVSTFE